MGYELQGNCSCGYSEVVLLGAGMNDYLTSLRVPHRCLDCKTLVTVDVLAPAPICSRCSSKNIKSYSATSKLLSDSWLSRVWFGRLTDLQLLGKGYHRCDSVLVTDSSSKAEDDVVILEAGNVCPRCEKKSLQFDIHSMWD